MDERARQEQRAIQNSLAAVRLWAREPPALPFELRVLEEFKKAAVECDRKQYAQAEKRLLALMPPHTFYAEALYAMLATVAMEQQRFDVAAEQLESAYTEKPRTQTLKGIAHAYWAHGRTDKAVAAYRQILAAEPNNALAHDCNVLYLLHDPRVTPQDFLAANRRAAALFDAVPRCEHHNRPDPDRPVRVGYFVGRPPQAEGRAVETVRDAHDPKAVEVVCYSNTPWEAPWRDLSRLDDAAAARTIQADGIDILVDVYWHLPGNRLGVFARKPAPVQATWIQCMCTTGLPAIDYVIADPVGLPPEIEPHFTEKVLRLPHAYRCWVPPFETPPVGPLPALSAGYVTFGSFSRLAKVNERALALWAEILRRVPGSRLYLRAQGLNSEGIADRYARPFLEKGVSRDRLIFEADYRAYQDNCACYHTVDIALDCLPFTGPTTATDALWMGCPVVTLAGQTFPARATASLVTAAGFPEFVARTPEEYVSIAVALAQDLPRLDRLRAELRPRMAASPLCDTVGFTRDLEALYRSMWRQWCSRGGES